MDHKSKVIILTILVLILFVTKAQAQSTPNGSLRIYQDAIVQLTQSIAKEPNSGLNYLNRAYAYMMIGAYDKALHDYEIAYEKTLAFEALLGIQWAAFSLKRYEKTIELGEEIIDREPNNYYALLRMAESYYELKEFKKSYTTYAALLDYHGEDSILIWKKGLAAFYAEDYIKADLNFKKAYSLSPNHPGIEYSYKNSKVYPYFVVTPEYSSSNFRGSSFLGRGERAGINLSIGLNEDWNFRLGVSRDQTQNLNSSKGIENYVFDPLVISYGRAAMTRAPITYPTYLSYLFGTASTVDSILNLSQSENYLTNRYSGGATYKLTEKISLYGSGNYLASNSSYLNAGHTSQLGVSFSNYYTVAFAASAINHPSSKGGQATLSFTMPFLDYFYTSSTLSGQAMSVLATAEKAKEQWLIYYFIIDAFANTVLNNSEIGTKARNYGYFQQEVGFNSKYFYSALGGRIGSARNPLFGESWIYPGFDLKNGAYGRIGLKWGAYSIQLDGSRDYWIDSRNDRPVSDNVKISIVGIF